MTTQYDSASFEADLDRIEIYLRTAGKILDSPGFRGHVDATHQNFSNTEGLIVQHEGIMSEILEAKVRFDEFAERIRTL